MIETIRSILKHHHDLYDKEIDIIFYNPSEKNTIVIASDVNGEIVTIGPFKNELNIKWEIISDWDFDLDNDFFMYLEYGYEIKFIKEELHNGILSLLNEVEKEEIDYKIGLEKYLKYYKENIDEKLYNNNPYSKKHKYRKVEILEILDRDLGDVRCEAILYQNKKAVAHVIASFDTKTVDELNKNNNIEDTVGILMCQNFNKYINLPKISKCSKLLKEVYDETCISESSMCFVDYDDWKESFANKYTKKDIEYLKKEISRYNLESIIEIDNGEFKILCYADLATAFNDDRKIKKERGKER